MIAFRSSAGISSVDIYKLMIWKAKSAYDKFFQLAYVFFLASAFEILKIILEAILKSFKTKLLQVVVHQ